ncbi:ABC transporter ATP-binding protein [Brevibacterium yomogidense]|uniref:Alkanesulfonates ABC transporter ATP-binding protein / Sulfonate ABC transporter, ATP-binding subunit SsuB n=1 Tax=Brevibacterium yomogidense TaxID=946573 RepID=A0A1X6XBZ0_9MICO|nr:ABC transporter ATP-binding protein [Brevibacterium yomogidense]SLM96613.1 Alkanesulfonates ABC transporter ATP-binding protein / Sulfonate ABC transporter, ATP-binding subunit SsuB [Brevibacterium yomogidense]
MRSSTPPAVSTPSASTVEFSSYLQAFGDRTVLTDVDLTVPAGELLVILGPSGCGKSTLLRSAAGLGTPTSGSVLIDGEAVTDGDERTAFAFQEPRLLPWRTLEKNTEIGLPRGTAKDASRTEVARLLDLVGLTGRGALRPREVSGGMAQRVSLARALARRPGVLLLDEPFGALDALTRLQMQDLLLAIHDEQPTTVLLVTHDVDEAVHIADRIVVLGPVSESPDAPATVVRDIRLDEPRPRDRGSAELAHVRADLLSALGIDTGASRSTSARGSQHRAEDRTRVS